MTNLISKEWAEYLTRYSYIISAEIKGIYLYLFYIIDGDLKQKRIPRRASPKHVLRILKRIRTEKGIKNDEHDQERKAFIE